MAVSAYLLITVKRGGEGKVVEKIRKKTGIIYAEELYGEYDIIAKIKKATMEDIQKFLIEEIRKIDEVDRTTTMISLDNGD